ncbi:MAG: hypothetical protein ACK4LQ_08250 [Pararhodobacter sp.]
MAAWRSPRAARPGWKGWVLSSLAVWLAPLPLGLGVLVLAYGLGVLLSLDDMLDAAHPLVVVHVAGYLLFFSPLMSWLGLLLALPLAWFLVRRGWGGWASFAVLGLAAGTLAGALLPNFAPAVASAFGLLAALAFRWILFRLSPEIFTAR